MKLALDLAPLLALSTIVACSGNTSTGVKDGAPVEATHVPPDVAVSPSTTPSTTAPSTTAAAVDPAAPSTGTAGVNLDTLRADTRDVCQGILDAPQLAPYLTAIPSRIPVRMIADGPCRDLQLEKHGKPVVFDGTPKSLHVTEVAISSSVATAKIVYRGEGLTGTFAFERQGGRFVLVKGSVAEH